MTGPTTEKQRYLILYLLRGLALMGIALANFPEFALWTFLSSDQQGAMTTADVDGAVRYVQFLLVDGKFYSIFSMLFGLGFALILMRHGRRLFVRRMLILMVIGFLHLLFIWSGDILLLYAVGGLLLALSLGHSTAAALRGAWGRADWLLLTTAVLLILLPVGLDALTEFCDVDFAGPGLRGADSPGCLPVSSAQLPPMAALFPLRPHGVGVANAHLRPPFPTEEIAASLDAAAAPSTTNTLVAQVLIINHKS